MGILSLRNGLLGVASWAIPFVASMPFFGMDGELAVDLITFKTAMILIGGVTGAWLLVLAFRRVPATMANGMALGFFWVGINWALDLAILVGAMGSDPVEWVLGIGLRYLSIPIMAVAIGAVGQWLQAENQHERH